MSSRLTDRPLSRLAVRTALLLPLLALCAGCTSQRISQIAVQSSQILREFDAAKAIPPEELAAAKAVAVVRETEGAAVVGFSGGEGVLLRRLDGGWSSPLAIDLWSASVGLQIGGQSRDIVLLFRDTASIDRMLSTGSATIGRAEGVFIDAQARTAPVPPEDNVVPFVRTGGIFGGMSVNGLSFRPSDRVNTRTYGQTWNARKVLAGDVVPAPGALTLWTLLDSMSAR